MEVIGSVDRCDEFVIEGWITIQGEPDKKLCLDVCLDEMPIGQCIADRYREDLKLAGLAEGLCAFWFDMPSFITNGDLEKIRIRLNNSVLFLDMKKPEAEGDVAAVPVPRDGSSGLWIDRADWLDRLALKHRTNKISDDLSLSIFQFVRDGFFLMEKALSNDMVDRLNDAVELVWRRPPESSLASADEPVKKTPNGTPEKRVKLLDLYAHSAVAREALGLPKVIDFLEAIFDDRPKAFRNETYWHSPGLGLHRDSDVLGVGVNKSAFAGLLIALEDMEAGSGEIECLIGSHRSAGVMPQETGPENREKEIVRLKEDAERYAQTSRTFRLKKGDVLILHADVAYGDVETANTDATRRSLLTHYMPLREEPLYQASSQFRDFPAANCHFVSQFSDVPGS